jgi:hypothetical protein
MTEVIELYLIITEGDDWNINTENIRYFVKHTIPV